MTIAQRVRLLVQWGPVVASIGDVVSAERGIARVNAALDLLDMVADKTKFEEDDELIAHLKAVVATPQGSELVDWLSDKVAAMFEDKDA